MTKRPSSMVQLSSTSYNVSGTDFCYLITDVPNQPLADVTELW